MPRRIGVDNRIAPLGHKLAIAFADFDHAGDASGIPGASLLSTNSLSGLEDFLLAPRDYLALLVERLCGYVSGGRYRHPALLDRTDKLGSATLEHLASAGYRALAHVQQL